MERLKPFSHVPGTSCLIPATTIEVEVFPALLRFYDISQERKLVKEIPIKVKGPVANFTVLQDLEKGVVTVFGEGLFYHILPDLTIKFQKKAPNQHLESFSRLFLGITKQQNWERIKERLDFREIFPIWLRIGSLLPEVPVRSFSLLEKIENLNDFKKLFLFAFRHMMVPRNYDEEHQGIFEGSVEGSPLSFLKEGAVQIERLFIQHEGPHIIILPHLFSEFVSGSMTDVYLDIGILSFEWSKRKVRKVILKSEWDGEIFFHLREEKRCRVNKKKTHIITNPLEIKSGGVYLLDRFEK